MYKIKLFIMEQKDKKKNIITLTYGDCAENHVGIQQLGKKRDMLRK